MLTDVLNRSYVAAGGSRTSGKVAPFSVGGVAFVLLLGLLWVDLDSPPFWDALWSTSTGAAELARGQFGLIELISQPGFLEGGPGTHAASLLTPILGALFALLGPESGLVAGHVLMIGIGSATAGSTFALSRRFFDQTSSLIVAAAVVSTPIVLQQIADIYVDLPIALLTLLALLAALDRRPVRVALLAAIAVWIKPIGLMLVPLVLVVPTENGKNGWLQRAALACGASSPFLIQLMARSSLTADAVIEPSIEGAIILVRTALVVLVSTTDMLVLLTLFLVACWHQRARHPALVKYSVTITAGFLGITGYAMLVSQYVTMLPRYYVAMVPVWLPVVAAHFREHHSVRVARGFCILIISFGFLNWSGSLYPLPNHGEPWMIERTHGAAREYEGIAREGTRHLVELSDDVDWLVAGRHVEFRLLYPEHGYVEETPPNLVAFADIQTRLPESIAWLDEPYDRSGEDVLTELIDENWSIQESSVGGERWVSTVFVAHRK